MREGFGHEGGQVAVLLGNRANHPLEESVTVGAGQGVRVKPIDLELAVGVFMVVGVRVPSQLLHVTEKSGHDIKVAVESTQIVAGLPRRIERIPGKVSSLLILFQKHELGLNSDIKDVALLPQDFEAVSKNGAWTVGPRLSIHVKVSGNPGNIPLPGQDGERSEIGDAHYVCVVWALVQIAGREARKTRALSLHLLPMGGGN